MQWWVRGGWGGGGKYMLPVPLPRSPSHSPSPSHLAACHTHAQVTRIYLNSLPMTKKIVQQEQLLLFQAKMLSRPMLPLHYIFFLLHICFNSSFTTSVIFHYLCSILISVTPMWIIVGYSTFNWWGLSYYSLCLEQRFSLQMQYFRNDEMLDS